MLIFWDIETRADDRAEAYYAAKVYEAPSNYVDPVKIAAAIEKERKADKAKAGLKWWTGAVCCITAQTERGDRFAMVGNDETTILRAFFDWCRGHESEGQCSYVAKNGSEFDTPFTIGRAMATLSPLPYQFSGKAAKVPLKDLDSIWGWGKHGQMGKLSDYAWGLGFEQGKLSHGSFVQGMYDRAEFAEIKTYCEQDTALVAQIVGIWLEVTQ